MNISQEYFLALIVKRKSILDYNILKFGDVRYATDVCPVKYTMVKRKENKYYDMFSNEVYDYKPKKNNNEGLYINFLTPLDNLYNITDKISTRKLSKKIIVLLNELNTDLTNETKSYRR